MICLNDVEKALDEHGAVIIRIQTTECDECDGKGGHGEEYGGPKGTLSSECGYCDGKGNRRVNK